MDSTLKGSIIAACAVIVAALIPLAVTNHWFSSGSPAPNSTMPGSTPTSTPTGGGSGAVGGSGSTSIYHKGTVKVAYATCIDLDAPPSDPQWGENSTGSGGTDLCSEYPDLAGYNNATLVTVTSGTNTACQNATGWIPTNSYQNLQLSVGSFVCVHTNQGRYSLLRVTAIDTATNAITFRAKTFK